MTCGVFAIVVVGVIVFFATNGVRDVVKPTKCVADPENGKFCHAAVSSDVKQCSEIGRY